MKVGLKSLRLYGSDVMLVILLLSLTLFSGVTVAEEIGEAEYVEASSIREMIRKLRNTEEFSRMNTENGNQEKIILYIYEGSEREYEAVGTTPPLENPEGAINNQTQVNLQKVNVFKDLKVPIRGTDKMNALSEGLTSEDTCVTADSKSGRFIIYDTWATNDGSWPLNWDLDETAKEPMTFDQAVNFLKQNYYWDDGSAFLVGKAPSLCDCGEMIVWNGEYEGKKVRDLLYAVLGAAHSKKVEQFGKNVISYQIIPLGDDETGIVSWNVLSI